MPRHTNHSILGGKVQLYRRGDSGYWWCSTSVGGKQRKGSTKEENLALAKNFAEDWYLELRGKSRAGLLKTEKTFGQAAEQFTKEYGIITEGQRSERWVEGNNIRLRLHLVPFFGELGVSEVTAGKVQEYRVHRATTPPVGSKQPVKMTKGETPAYKPPSRSTLHDEVVTLRLVLKTAIRHGWLSHLPDLSPPYRTQGKIVHRPWFSPDEYKQLYQATREYARTARAEHRWEAEQLHDYVLFLGNTGLRPDEAKNLEHRDVSIEEEDGEKILHIEVRGKRGVGYCKSMPGAVLPYQRLRDRPKPTPVQTRRARRRRGEDLSEPPPAIEFSYPEPTEKVFPGNHINGSGRGVPSALITAEQAIRKECGFSQILVDDLKAHRLQITRAHLAADFGVAFDLALYSLGVALFDHGYRDRPLDLRAAETPLRSSLNDLADTPADRLLEAERQALDTAWLSLPAAAGFAALSALPPEAKQRLFAWCIAATLNGQLAVEDRPDPVVEHATRRLAIPFADHWRPTAANYWGRVKKAHGLEVARALLGPRWARDHADDKKPILAAALEVAFDPAASSACIGLDQAALDSAVAWLPPGFAYTPGLDDADSNASGEAAADEAAPVEEEIIEGADLPAFLTDDEPPQAVANGAAMS